MDQPKTYKKVLFMPTPGSRYYTSPPASKTLKWDDNPTRSTSKRQKLVIKRYRKVFIMYRNINLFPFRSARITTDLRID